MGKLIYILFFLIGVNLDAKEAQKLVWPSPPDDARIEYITIVKTPKDFGVEKGFFSRAFDYIFGTKDPSLSAPFGLHSDKERLYITDVSSKEVYIFDKEEDDSIVLKGSDNESFLYPIDVVTDTKGNIYVSDSVLAKIYVFENDGDFSHTISSNSFKRPIGIAFCSKNNKLYVVDSVANKIHILTKKGKLIKSIGKKGNQGGEFNRPTFIDIGNDGKIYVTDSMNHRVQILDSDGKFIGKFGEIGQKIGHFGSPRGISVDTHENIYVGDTMYNTIQIFNKNGELLMVFGEYGGSKGQFSLAEDISITDDNTIYISDTNNRRVQVFKLLEPAVQRSTK